MPALKPNTLFPTDEEDTLITTAALSDPDTILLTDDEWEQIKLSVHVANVISTSLVRDCLLKSANS